MPIKRPIYLVTIETQYRLAATFLRFQEHYESPQFRKKIFTLEEFMDWYATERGNFTYYGDWSGFNVPSWVLKPFFDGLFNPLSNKEQALLDVLKDVKDDYYVIGVSNEIGIQDALLKHEFLHGLFYTVPHYRSDVQETLRALDISKICSALGSKAGYAPEVFEDETHAYALTYPESLGTQNVHTLLKIRQQLLFA